MPGFLNTILRSPTHPILLRNPETRDAPAYSRILSNPANNEFDPTANPISASQCETVIERMRVSASEPVPTRVNFVIVQLPSIGSEEEGEVIGLSGFGGIDEVERDGRKLRFADAGAMLDPEFRGKGYAFESMRLSIDFALKVLKVDGITCQTDEKNVAMVALAEKKFGWKGVRKQGKDGEWSVKYEISPGGWEEWKKLEG